MVEDNSAARMVVSELLEDVGHRVLAVDNAASALAIIEAGRERVDLVLTDISLPDMPGTRLVPRIREVLPAMPVIYMSGFDSADVELGPSDGYLTKPFELDELLRLVEQALARVRGG